MFGLRVLLPLRIPEHRKGYGTFNGRRTAGLSRISSQIDNINRVNIIIVIIIIIEIIYELYVTFKLNKL